MKIIFSPKCLEYSFPGHPESPERVSSVAEFLKDSFSFTEPKPCPEAKLLTVHTERLVESVKTGSYTDSDTPYSPEMYSHAKLSAGAAVKAAELALEGEKTFSLMRPPGHHAGRDFLGGFCYFNNMAVAVARLLKGKQAERIAILDIDCHHGNGSEDIFSGNRNVLYVSIHQAGIFPGTGLHSRENCLNFHLPAGTSEKEYLKALKTAIEDIKKFRPEIIGISAGFDTYKGDPLCSLNLETGTYKKIGELIKKLNLPAFSLLEGGYSPELKLCVKNFLEGLEV
jgi:acetoin utilization deacetylase AcuC-like enzyme